jgi:hypothetical protein
MTPTRTDQIIAHVMCLAAIVALAIVFNLVRMA